MFTETMARITSEFTAQILEVLREASREELSARRQQQSRAAAKTRAPKAVKVASAYRTNAARTPAAHLTSAATGFFAERGRKGATADQLNAHFADLGIAEQGEAVLDQLARDGVVSDAGFRRSTGTGHRTMPVYVSAR